MSRWWLDRLRGPWPGARSTAVEWRVTDTRPEAIGQQLDALALPPSTPMTCIVAGEGARYQIVPWRDELSRPAQRQLLAEQCFREAYGDAARGWTVRQQATRYGAAALACAIDTALLDQLDAQSQARRLALVSVQPALMHGYNLVRHKMSPELTWFVAVDAVSTTLLLQSPAEPLWVKRIPSPVLDLAHTLDRDWFALGMESTRCPVYLLRSEGAVMPRTVLPWQVIDLTPVRDAATPAPVALSDEVTA